MNREYIIQEYEILSENYQTLKSHYLKMKYELEELEDYVQKLVWILTMNRIPIPNQKN